VKIQLPGNSGTGELHPTPHRRVGHWRGEHFGQQIGRNIPQGTPLVDRCEII
jgi:hypothetical protein